MAYVLDANVFMQAKNLHYGLDFCPAFWDWLIEANAQSRVFSIERVGDEIEAGADELSDWAAQRGPDFFLKPDADSWHTRLPTNTQLSRTRSRPSRPRRSKFPTPASALASNA